MYFLKRRGDGALRVMHYNYPEVSIRNNDFISVEDRVVATAVTSGWPVRKGCRAGRIFSVLGSSKPGQSLDAN